MNKKLKRSFLAAGIVVGKVGAATASAEELRVAMQEHPVVMERWD